jgi:hypothetical protein
MIKGIDNFTHIYRKKRVEANKNSNGKKIQDFVLDT